MPNFCFFVSQLIWYYETNYSKALAVIQCDQVFTIIDVRDCFYVGISELPLGKHTAASKREMSESISCHEGSTVAGNQCSFEQWQKAALETCPSQNRKKLDIAEFKSALISLYVAKRNVDGKCRNARVTWTMLRIIYYISCYLARQYGRRSVLLTMSYFSDKSKNINPKANEPLSKLASDCFTK